MQLYSYQKESLRAIESARRSGRTRVLVVMATGLGKTVISALQLKHMVTEAPGRILYIAHQNEILRQAHAAYKKILGPKTTFGYFHGTEKHLHRVDVLFASFQTMHESRKEFAPSEFAYIVVDEAHHVHANTYRPTVEYFQPKFMMGLTATPDRADQKDITELMGEPVFHLDLFEALADQHLTAIDYHLMTDELQHLEMLDTPAGKLSITELNRTIFVPKRDEEIVRIIDERTVTILHPRVMIFCASIAHAEQLEELMPHAILVHSKMPLRIRQKRISEFRTSRASTIITVDLFNEGIDIPEVNVIVFLRSTASRTIFLQQLGRGLRRVEGKEKVLVLDFVANCERIEMVGHLQRGVANAIEAREENTSVTSEGKFILTLTIDSRGFDERLVNLVNLIERVRQGYTKEELTEQLLEFAAELGRSPTTEEVDGNSSMMHSATYVRTFGKSWNGVLQEVGLQANQLHRSREELSEQLSVFARELGRTPTYGEVNAHPLLASGVSYQREFGSWNNALEEAGLAVNSVPRKRTKEELTEQLLEFAKEIGRSPSHSEVTKNPSMASGTTYLNVFGTSWNEILREVGLVTNRKRRSKEELTEQLLALAQRLGRTPTKVEVNKCPETATASTYERVFEKSWRSILIEVGLQPRVTWSRRKK